MSPFPDVPLPEDTFFVPKTADGVKRPNIPHNSEDTTPNSEIRFMSPKLILTK